MIFENSTPLRCPQTQFAFGCRTIWKSSQGEGIEVGVEDAEFDGVPSIPIANEIREENPLFFLRRNKMPMRPTTTRANVDKGGSLGKERRP